MDGKEIRKGLLVLSQTLPILRLKYSLLSIMSMIMKPLFSLGRNTLGGEFYSKWKVKVYF